MEAGSRSLLIFVDGNRNPPNVIFIAHVPLMNSGYTCAAGGMLKTEFFNKAGSFLASLLAKPLGEKGDGAVSTAAATAESGGRNVETAVATPIASLRLICDQLVT